ncbi:glycosyltransferase [Sporolactobacillus shoreae]|uniref:Glycosyltransferase n=1 Tax=Sporolactobacillus shoreae TaxID=1465501 RepID=A0A4Z0GLK3_9BACL|nr:glycosyltransferase [Sporolactobacillus shoreae]TGA97863.1 glycosyltransferase [Sporolactobacillus shoreae]
MDIARVLILTGSYGSGHKQAAYALSEAFANHPSKYTARVLDVTSLMPSKLDSLEKHTFLSGVTHFPSLYHYIYKKTQKNNAAASLLKTINRFGIDHLITILDEERPDLVISTFPAASVMMSQIKREGWFTSSPFLTLITDYSFHSSWVNSCTDGYLVGSDAVRDKLIEMNVDSQKIITTGIPIQSGFSFRPNAGSLRAKLHIPANQKVLLMLGGGCGIFRNTLPILRAVDKMDTDFRVVLICGQNQKAYNDFSKFGKTSRHPVHVEGYVDNMNEWMAVSDLLVTKPGGLTISEAIASELPMIIYKPLGGQEADNTQYLLSSGLAVAAPGQQELIENVGDLLSNTQSLNTMRGNMKLFSSRQRHSSERALKAAELFLSAARAIEFA